MSLLFASHENPSLLLEKRMHTTIKRGETQRYISVVARSTKEKYRNIFTFFYVF